MRKLFIVCLAVLALGLSSAVAQDSSKAAPASNRIELPKPDLSAGIPLNQALAGRRTPVPRAFLPTPLTKAELSQILWAANGLTGPEERRTAPSAANQHYVHIFVTSAEGFFEYLPVGHQLQKISGEDLRAKFSNQQAVTQAPTVLLLVGDYERAAVRYPGEKGPRFIALEGGHIAQNVLLEASALGLGAVPVGGFEPKDVNKAASLPAQQSSIYLLTIGHPKK
jgi:SagB-type dehydrogenase family enzyme